MQEPWSGKIPHAMQQQPVCHNYWACTRERGSHNYWSSWTLDPVLCNERSNPKEKPECCSERVAPFSATRAKPVQQQKPSTAPLSPPKKMTVWGLHGTSLEAQLRFCLPRRGCRFNPWLGNQDPTCPVMQPRKLKKKKKTRQYEDCK